ncbi:MAG: glutathione S-transferase family protein, partial [Gammaproteobacteria bacterium]
VTRTLLRLLVGTPLARRPANRSMRLFDFERAPNPRRVRIFLAEKGVELPIVRVNLFEHEQLTPEFRAINPSGTVPVLETDDGAYLTEAIAICHYLENLYPEPPLFGSGPLEQARVLMWSNIVENEGLGAVAEVLRNWSPGFRGRALPGPTDLEQIPELVARGRKRCATFFDRVEQQLSRREWLAAGHYSVADITLLATIDFAGWVDMDPAKERPGLRDWHRRASARPSSRA